MNIVSVKREKEMSKNLGKIDKKKMNEIVSKIEKRRGKKKERTKSKDE